MHSPITVEITSSPTWTKNHYFPHYFPFYDLFSTKLISKLWNLYFLLIRFLGGFACLHEVYTPNLVHISQHNQKLRFLMPHNQDITKPMGRRNKKAGICYSLSIIGMIYLPRCHLKVYKLNPVGVLDWGVRWNRSYSYYKIGTDAPSTDSLQNLSWYWATRKKKWSTLTSFVSRSAACSKLCCSSRRYCAFLNM